MNAPRIDIGTWGMRGFELIAEGRSIAVIKYGKLKTAERIAALYAQGRRPTPEKGLRDEHYGPGDIETRPLNIVSRRPPA